MAQKTASKSNTKSKPAVKKPVETKIDVKSDIDTGALQEKAVSKQVKIFMKEYFQTSGGTDLFKFKRYILSENELREIPMSSYVVLEVLD